MNDTNPDNLEGKQPQSPEEIEASKRHVEAQESANEMLDAMVEHDQAEKPFRPAYASDKLVTGAENVGLRPEQSTPIDTEETGLPRVESEKLRRNPLAWIREAIGKKLAADQKVEGLIEALGSKEKEERD